MNDAKNIWLLSNGKSVSIGDNIQIDKGRTVYMVKVTDIGKTYIIGEIGTGGEFNAYFKDLK